jgi:hypothetical protein
MAIDPPLNSTLTSTMTLDKTHRSRTLVLHPFFFGMFPLFSLLSANLVWAGFGEVFLPVAVILAISAFLWLALWPLLPQPHKRGLVLALFWIPFYGYSTIIDGVRTLFDFRDMLGALPLIAIGLVALVLALVVMLWLRRAPWTFEATTTVLNRISALALTVAFLSCVVAVARQVTSTGPSESRPAEPTAAADPSLPNIYFILCDAYPRADYLQSYFGIDNTPFLTQLRERGFYVADRSRSNYPNTLPSLASTFNLEYLDNAMATGGWDEHYPELLPRVRDNTVVQSLQARGYEFVAIASGLFPTDLSNADRFIHPGATFQTEYQQRLIDMTPIRSIFNRMKKPRWHHRVPFVLESLETIRREDRPMFVFGHILAPHLPHAYDAEGNVLASFPPYKDGWRQVTQFLNRRLVEVVDAILAHEPNSVILIEGDHGPNTSWQDAINLVEIPWKGTWEDYVRDRSANLSAFYFPDRQYEGLLYPEITPVNTFRVIFNKYFGADYEMLEDVTYLSPQRSSEIRRITEVH